MFKTTDKEAVRDKNHVAEVVNTIEWLVTAFILAFVFRAFVMEAFRIPTGSMADTLKGAHFQLRCPQCGQEYDHGFVPDVYRLPEDSMPPAGLKVTSISKCPNCGYYYNEINGASKVGNGDRILVLKCLYQFFEPHRWDVIVFKKPQEPKINYIKRLIGKPGETVEIIDGDIYINGKIARKSPKVQEELWMPVYNNDLQPAKPHYGIFNGQRNWEQPWTAKEGSSWQVDPENATKFLLDGSGSNIHTMFYDTNKGNNFRSTYAYNNRNNYRNMEFCSDLKVDFYAKWEDKNVNIGAGLSKYGTMYNAMVSEDGVMSITSICDGQSQKLIEKQIDLPSGGKEVAVKFVNVDHKLVFGFGGNELTFDLGKDPNSMGEIKAEEQSEIEIYGSGKVAISHVNVSRDIHYISSYPSGQAINGPFTLKEDEFFVCGDNSANSLDSRLWSEKGIGNDGKFYRLGIVPREYLVGKALFVYWPNGFRPTPNSRLGLIPNVGKLRLIHGGNNKEF